MRRGWRHVSFWRLHRPEVGVVPGPGPGSGQPHPGKDRQGAPSCLNLKPAIVGIDEDCGGMACAEIVHRHVIPPPVFAGQ